MNRLGLNIWAYPTKEEVQRVINLLDDKHPHDTFTARTFLKSYVNTQNLKSEVKHG